MKPTGALREWVTRSEPLSRPQEGIAGPGLRPIRRLQPLAKSALLPVLAAFTYLIALAVRLPRILDSIYWNSDNSAYARMTEDLAANGLGGLINLGNQPAYSTLWYFRATVSLPFHRELWAFSPYILSLLAVGVLVWAVVRIAGPWAALLAFSIAAAASPTLLSANLPTGRTPTWLANSILCAVLVAFLTREGRPTPKARFLTTAALGLLAGVTLASDPLFVVAGLGPFVLSAVVQQRLYRNPKSKDLLIVAGASAGIAVVFAVAASLWMHSLGFRATFPSAGFSFASREEIVENVQAFGADLLLLANADFFDRPPGLHSAAAMLLAPLAAIAYLCPTLLAVSALARNRRSQDPAVQATTAHLMFWSLASLGVCAGFVLSAVPVGTGRATARYLTPAFYALAATVPLWAGRLRWRRVLTGSATTIFCLLSIVGINHFKEYEKFSLARQGSKIIDFLEAQDVERGYSGYWNSHGLTYKSEMKLHVSPLLQCRTPPAYVLCEFPVASRTRWYRPRSERSFLIVDPSIPVRLSLPPPPDLGEPALQRRFGDIWVFVYDYDLASRISKFVQPKLP